MNYLKEVAQVDPTIYYSQPKLNLTSTNTHSNRVKINIENIEAVETANHSNASSARSERSERMTTKILPPVIMSHKHLVAAQHHSSSHNNVSSSTAVIPSQTAPFLNSTQSTLHSRVVKKLSSGSNTDRNSQSVDILQRRTLITLPPIQKNSVITGDMIGNQLAVESPLKINNANAASAHNQNNAT